MQIYHLAEPGWLFRKAEPLLLDATSTDSGPDNVVNPFYHWGSTSQNEMQYFGEYGSALFNFGFQINPALTPYATANCVNIVISGGPCTGTGGVSFPPSGLFLSPNVALIDFAPIFPTQVGLHQNTNYPDHEDENHVIQKINFKHQFSASSFAQLRVFRTQSNVNFPLPWNGGALNDFYEFDGSDNKAIRSTTATSSTNRMT